MVLDSPPLPPRGNAFSYPWVSQRPSSPPAVNRYILTNSSLFRERKVTFRGLLLPVSLFFSPTLEAVVSAPPTVGHSAVIALTLSEHRGSFALWAT